MLFDKSWAGIRLLRTARCCRPTLTGLARPPYDASVSRSADGISIKGWKLEACLISPGRRHLSCRPRKSSFARSRTLPRSRHSVVIATDFDGEGGADRFGRPQQGARGGADFASRPRPSILRLPRPRIRRPSITSSRSTRTWPTPARASAHRPHLGAVLTRYLTPRQVWRLWQRAFRRPRADADAFALVVERERERMAFVPGTIGRFAAWVPLRALPRMIALRSAHKTARFTDKDAAETAYGHVDGVRRQPSPR